MAPVDTNVQLAGLRALMKENKIDVYGNHHPPSPTSKHIRFVLRMFIHTDPVFIQSCPPKTAMPPSTLPIAMDDVNSSAASQVPQEPPL